MNLPMLYFVVPRLDRTGGYERQAVTLAAELLRQPGVRLQIITDAPAAACAHLPEPVRQCCRHFAGMNGWALYRQLRALWRAPEPSVVHVHALYKFSAVALLAAQAEGCPTLLKLPTETDARLLFESPRIMLRLFRPWLRRVAAFVCPSHALEDEVRPYLSAPDRAVYVPNAVDMRRYAPGQTQDRRQLGIPFQRVVLFVGRHVARKNGDVLLRAFAQCQAALPAGTGLVFVGEGEELLKWQTLAGTLGLGDQVLFAGHQPEPGAYYRAADAFVFPSRVEGMPNALLEAMASGLPCVATRIGGVTELLADKFPSQLVTADDVAALAAKLPGLLAADAVTLGAAMRRHVEEQFSVGVVAGRLLELYAQLWQNRSS